MKLRRVYPNSCCDIKPSMVVCSLEMGSLIVERAVEHNEMVRFGPNSNPQRIENHLLNKWWCRHLDNISIPLLTLFDVKIGRNVKFYTLKP